MVIVASSERFTPRPATPRTSATYSLGYLNTSPFYYSFHIRVRETTIYGRWTTNGYDFHVELQNTSATDMCAWVEAYPNSGTVYNGAAPHLNIVNVPAYGANKIVIPNGTLVGTDNRGTLRINTCKLSRSPTFTTGALHVSTYAFNLSPTNISTSSRGPRTTATTGIVSSAVRELTGLAAGQAFARGLLLFGTGCRSATGKAECRERCESHSLTGVR